MKINTIRLFSPDFTLGKILIKSKAILQVFLFIISHPNKESYKVARLILKVKPNYTMVRNRNLINLYESVQRINQDNTFGDIVECGVWNGGSAAIMGVSCIEGQYPTERRIWLFDSFQGLPPPGKRDEEKVRSNYFDGWNLGSKENVKQIFSRLNFPLQRVNIISGWFDETLETAPIDNIAILHIDADWYDSVKIVLDTFYGKVTLNGFVIIDDYFSWKGCKNAVYDFFAENYLDTSIIKFIKKDGAYFQKP